jgi:GTPase SAR1 family protein
MANVQKIIIVGEPETGKTSLIQCFLDYDGELNKSLIEDAKPKQHNIINPNSDFSLKIINIGGEKARL